MSHYLSPAAAHRRHETFSLFHFTYYFQLSLLVSVQSGRQANLNTEDRGVTDELYQLLYYFNSGQN